MADATERPDSKWRYTGAAVAIHWLLALALIGEIAFGFMVDSLAQRGTPARSMVVNLHKSTGLVLGVLVAARLLWRLRHAPPPWPESMTPGQRRAAHWIHLGLYACMLAIPLSGYVASNFSRFGIVFFGHLLPPWGPAQPQVYAFIHGIHVVTGYVFCVLIAVHVLAALKHALIDRDHVFQRMWI